MFAAQIHQESTWDPKAQSRYASGLAQFTKPTETDMQRWYGETLGPDDALNPVWALRALVLYDKRIRARISSWGAYTLSECDRWAMTLAGYNGGPTWIKRDRILTRENGFDPDRWWGHTENFSNRAGWAMKENRDYPRKILYQHEPLYRANGWRGAPVCG